ncbi:MAG TPA: TolC family protein, partial [Holophaga sp.]|nr:TolC family protein [Holophaga sp.]
MRLALLLVLGLLPVRAQAPLADDPRLQALIQEALDANPDLRRSRAAAQAERERIPQAGALPDPTLSLGLQNDGFKKLQIGQMESSYWQVMVTQGLPWPGKLALRTDIARMGSQAAEASADRSRLGLEAEVRRAYLALLLAKGQMALLEEQAHLLRQAEATARIRYEVGQGAQADLLRAQLERTRLDQTRLRLESDARTALAGLNRLRARPADAPFEPGTLEGVSDPPAIDPAAALPQVMEHTPEVRSARIGAQQSEKAVALAKLDRRPDFGVTAGIMPRGGFDPMWSAGVSI